MTLVPETPFPEITEVITISPTPSSPTILFSSTLGWKLAYPSIILLDDCAPYAKLNL